MLLKNRDKLTWTSEAEKAFEILKILLQTSPTLGLPYPERNFVQTVDEKNGFVTSVLLQDHGGKLRPVAYFSSKLDPVAAGLPKCLRAVASAEKAILASRGIVGYSDVTLLVPHAVSMILLEQRTSHLSTARWLRYNAILLEMPNITIKRCKVLNPTTLLPTEKDGEEHDCVATLEQVCTPRPDLKETPLENADLILFVDGSASRDPKTGKNRAGYAVTTAYATITSGALPAHCSAQAAELVALTEACKIAEGQTVTIYTDSRYSFGVCHDFGALCRGANLSPFGEIRRFHLEIGHSRESCRSVKKIFEERGGVVVGSASHLCHVTCSVFFPLLAMDPPYSVSDWPTLGTGLSPIFFMTAKRTKNTLVSFDCTDKNKVSFETAKGLLLFLYSHNNNKIMCFSKINKINGVRSLPALSLSPFFTDT